MIGLGTIAILGISMWASLARPPELKVFLAGSLMGPFEELESSFEDEFHIDVQLEPHGSVEAIMQITELNRSADLVAVADYTLIPQMMMPEHADWYIIFAGNEMVLAFKRGSKHASDINENNWYRILGEPEVRFGFSDPNLDPCGYRTLMLIQLSELHYENDEIFEDLISTNTGIESKTVDGGYIIEVPSSEYLEPNTDKIEISPKSVELLSRLEEGGLDYAFEYKSVAVQHGFEFLEFPPQLNLGDKKFENVYSQIRVYLSNGKIKKRGKPILYGVTIPKGAKREVDAVKFIQMLIGEEGQRILESKGQPPVFPPVLIGEDLPEELSSPVGQ